MKRFVMLAFMVAVGSAHADWSYSAPNGPAQWGNMAGFATCSTGADQSPIAIESGEVAGLRNAFPDNSLAPLMPQWNASPLNLLNNGHTLQVNYAPGSEIEFETNAFELKQFHFHSPSEHLLNERQYPLEAHFVHQTANGGLLVVGVFFKQGADHPSLESIWKNAPQAGSSVSLPITVNAADFLPNNSSYFTYAGSLTTPPCSEGVRWIVLKEPLEASAAQLRFLQQHMGFTNNRPAQPLDGRLISIGNEN